MQNRNVKHYYRIGGKVFCLDAPDFEENSTLGVFRTEKANVDFGWKVSVHDSVKMPQGRLLFHDGYEDFYEREEGLFRVITNEVNGRVLFRSVVHGDLSEVQAERSGMKYWAAHYALRLMDLPRLMPKLGGVFLHASYIDVGGEAVLFTGRKQVGKSTQAALWARYRGAEVINGDRALLRASEGHFRAYGSPYCGTSGICLDRDLPVKAVVILSQAPENHVVHVGVRQALASMLDGCSFDTWDAEAVGRVMDISRDLIAEVPFYALACVPDESAVKALEELWQREKEK